VAVVVDRIEAFVFMYLFYISSPTVVLRDRLTLEASSVLPLFFSYCPSCASHHLSPSSPSSKTSGSCSCVSAPRACTTCRATLQRKHWFHGRSKLVSACCLPRSATS